jgi:hypothetical protein
LIHCHNITSVCYDKYSGGTESKTERKRKRQKETERDRKRQKETERDRKRQKETERDRKSPVCRVTKELVSGGGNHF